MNIKARLSGRFTVSTMLLLGIAIAIFLLVYISRTFRLATSFDIFIDEITYVNLSASVRLNGWASLYGQPFHLHPPAFFYLEALFLRLFSPPDDLFNRVYAVRYLNVILAGFTGVSIFIIVRHLSGVVWGIFAALLFAADAFIIRMNSMNLLDTAALFWVTAGWAVIVVNVQDKQPVLSRKSVLLASLFFGLGLLTKDMTAFLSIAVLLGMLVTGWFLGRRDAFFMIIGTSFIYSIYVAGVIFAGEWTVFYEEKVSGLLRLIGLHQATGINREQGPSLVSKIFERLSEFGMTYVLFALGILSILALFTWGRTKHKIIASWALGAYALLAYTVVFGTLEEQFFYFLIIPCVIIVSSAFSCALEQLKNFGVVKMIVVLFALLFGIVSGREWIIRHFYPDDGFYQINHYIEQNQVEIAQIASSSETGQFLLTQYGSGPWGRWHTIEDILQYSPPFILLSYSQLEWDYGALAQPMIRWVETHGKKLFEVNYRSNHLILFQLSYPVK